MSETYLWLLSAVIVIFAMWRKSPAAMWFGALVFGHGYFLGELVETDPLSYLITGGVFSTLSMAGCYYLRKGSDDSIAFWLAGISALCLSVNIVCIIVWLFGYPMGGFNYVFAGILLTSILVILKGDRGGLGRSEGYNMDYHAYNLPNKRSHRVVGVENRETSE